MALNFNFFNLERKVDLEREEEEAEVLRVDFMVGSFGFGLEILMGVVTIFDYCAECSSSGDDFVMKVDVKWN